jgi:predicted transcriptional regulator
MEGNDASEKVNLNQVVEIVSSYVRQNTIATEELPRLIADVYRALAGVRQPMHMREPRMPSVCKRYTTDETGGRDHCGELLGIRHLPSAVG